MPLIWKYLAEGINLDCLIRVNIPTSFTEVRVSLPINFEYKVIQVNLYPQKIGTSIHFLQLTDLNIYHLNVHRWVRLIKVLCAILQWVILGRYLWLCDFKMPLWGWH